MSLDLNEESRNVYTFLDVLGNVGGLAAVLASVASAINDALNHQRTENYLVKELYKPTLQKQFKERTVSSSFKGYLRECLPSCLSIGCLRPTNKDKYYEKGRETLARELDIVELLRNVRFYKLALKELLGQDMLNNSRKNAQKTAIKFEE